ncbi:hypothetical protein SAMD00019534_117340, partial [Acytostelium subglobosum LB1]|uniref:hypothetical protein n=1 Tax=Acytostelium subglobosum LB1 TaxID=1410327 RepID=UPI000644E2EB
HTMTTTAQHQQSQASIVDDDSNALTDYEAALYDRGIRVWGVDAQNRLRRSRVLVVGLGGLNSELVKNIALAGVGQINIIDHHIVTQHDIGLFITSQCVGQTRAEASLAGIAELNPLIHVRADTLSLDAIDNEYVKGFTLVCVDTLDSALQLRLNVLCRMNNIPFILTHSFGMQAYFFSDLGQVLYQFQQSHNRLPVATSESDIKELLKMLEDNNKRYNITPVNKNADIVTSAMSHLHTEIAPVCAIVGGIVGQEIVKVICRDNEVLNNFFFYDALKGSGLVEPVNIRS